MFQPTKAFKDELTSYPQEPCLRIGKRVPNHAVNLAYYFNPTATDSEKVITAEAPKVTIDHRVEEDYRYKFNLPKNDDNQFPSFVMYEDEEGYSGRLGRMYVEWTEDAHVNTKSITTTKKFIIANKEEVPKFLEYPRDIEDYEGTLYLDSADYVVTKTKEVDKGNIVARNIFNHEISYNKITGNFIPSSAVDKWMLYPPNKQSKWPRCIQVTSNGYKVIKESGDNTCDSQIKTWIESQPSNYDGATGYLYLKEEKDNGLELEPKSGAAPEAGEAEEKDISSFTMYSKMFTVPPYREDGLLHEIEEPYATYVKNAIKEYGRSDYIGYLVSTNEEGWITVGLLLTSFSITAYDAGGDKDSNFEATGWWFYHRDPSDGIWRSNSDYIHGVSNGDNFTKNIRYATRYLYYGTDLVYPHPDKLNTSVLGTYNNVPFSLESKALEMYYMQCGEQALEEFRCPTSRKGAWEAEYIGGTAVYNYSQVDQFKSYIKSTATDNMYGKDPGGTVAKYIDQAKTNKRDIAIWVDENSQITIELAKRSNTEQDKFRFLAKYRMKISGETDNGDYEYNVIAVYATKNGALGEQGGPLVKSIPRIEYEPAEYEATCWYKGIVRKLWYDYDGMAYYRGAVTKGNIANAATPDQNDEELMYPDANGYLRRPVYITDEFGNTVLHNFYRVEADYVYITNVFKNRQACFYKYNLKKCIYDYRGPDTNGWYEGDAVKIFTADMKDIPKNYKYNLRLIPAAYEDVQTINQDFQQETTRRPVKYFAELYTSFISNATNTFKVTYNAFDDNGQDNVALENGVTEDIYGYPYMIADIDYSMEVLDRRSRINRIKLSNKYKKDNSYGIRDTRHYISFTYQIIATRLPRYAKDSLGNIITNADDVPQVIEGVTYISHPRTVGILNKDFAIPAEYDKFDGRAYIISPKENGLYMSPFEIVLADQAVDGEIPVIQSTDTDFVFKVYIEMEDGFDLGSVNIKCNPDGSGYITAETTLDTGFENENGEFTGKLALDNPYFVENGYIYPGFKVKHIDSRFIKVLPPREEQLLQSWYPRIQFGHYSQIFDQAGACTKIAYGMPEYDTQHYSDTYHRPYVEIKGEQLTILNSHMLKTKCYPLFITYNTDTNNTYNNKIPLHIRVYRMIDDKEYQLSIKDVSFSDGIIIMNETISENDKILCDYIYVEESYIYRGFWRSLEDFVRIDLNPNIYHTFSDPKYTPSEEKPSKNLFNKVIYFFMRPSTIYEIDSEYDVIRYEGADVMRKPQTKTIINTIPMYEKQPIFDWETMTVLSESDLKQLYDTSIPRNSSDPTNDWRWDDTYNSFVCIPNTGIYTSYISGDEYEAYAHRVTLKSNDIDDDCIGVTIAYYQETDGTEHTLDLLISHGCSVYYSNRMVNGNYYCAAIVKDFHLNSNEDCNTFTIGQINATEQGPGGEVIAYKNIGRNSFGWKTITNGVSVYITRLPDEVKVWCAFNEEKWLDGKQPETEPDMDIILSSDERTLIFKDKKVHYGYGAYSQPQARYSNAIIGFIDFSMLKYENVLIGTREESIEQTYYEYEEVPDEKFNILVENDNCIYHKLDDSQPDDSKDVYIGSVYIRQNTSLHSTVLVDSRTRGGGLITGMTDSLRKELEPESDFYLDIGYYDGEPYQENGVIIVRLDNHLLKEFGGRFTHSEIESKVKRWLGVGVYPIIEFVDTYSKRDMPQYTLQVEDSFSNVVNIQPQISLEYVSD